MELNRYLLQMEPVQIFQSTAQPVLAPGQYMKRSESAVPVWMYLDFSRSHACQLTWIGSPGRMELGLAEKTLRILPQWYVDISSMRQVKIQYSCRDTLLVQI